MKETLIPGLAVDFTYRVSADRTVPSLLPESEEFGTMPQVLATGYMVALFDWACILAVNPHLDWPEEQTVGTHVNFSHVAATPPGFTLHIRGHLESIEGRKLVFILRADDGVDLVSEGDHERFIINKASFDGKMLKKRNASVSESNWTP